MWDHDTTNQNPKAAKANQRSNPKASSLDAVAVEVQTITTSLNVQPINLSADIVKKPGYFEIVCRSKPAQVTEVAEGDGDTTFLGEINSLMQNDNGPWKAKLHVRFGDKPERSA